MQCAQECSKAACGAFYVQVKLDSIRIDVCLVKRLNTHKSVETQQCGRVPCEMSTELIVLLPKADGSTCSLVPEDDAEGYKDVTNLASADFNYFYKLQL